MKILGVIFTLLFLISFISALDCQYTEIKKIDKEKIEYSIDGKVEDIVLPFIEAVDIWDGKNYAGTTRNYKFTIKNNLDHTLDFDVFYNAEGLQRIHNFTLAPFASQFVQGTYSQNLPFFDSTSIHFDIKNLEEEVVYYSEDLEICKICGNNICLNDGLACESNSECGANNCSPAKKCGEFTGCPEGRVLRGNTCVDNLFTLIKKNIWWILSPLLAVALIWYFFWRGLNEKQQKQFSKKISILQKQIQDRKNEIYGLEDKLKSSKRKKKEIEKINRELEILRKQEKDKFHLLQNEKSKLKQEKLKPYKNIQGVSVHINENGYEVFHNTGRLFHLWWYQKNNGNIPNGYEIHHKNGIKTDNKIKNLQAISKEKHRIIHGGFFR